MERAALLQVMVLANEPKEGDQGLVAAPGGRGGLIEPAVRQEARRQLAALTLGEIDEAGLVEDGMTESLRRAAAWGGAAARQEALQLAALRVGEVKQILLGSGGAAWVARHCEVLPSEAIAAVVKGMTDGELSQVARKVFQALPDDGGGGALAIGAPGHFGSRIQPNSPGDSEREILLSVLEGLSYGCGDVILGLNPASDDVDTIIRLEQLLESVVVRLGLPTKFCVLSDLLKQSEAAKKTRVQVGFQSLAGTATALAGMVGLSLDEVAELSGGFEGLYFETGQGSEVTNGAALGVDMVTLEARCYGAARYVRQAVTRRKGRRPWMIVNDVAGFIGPEVFRSGAQLLRACLEDTVMAKLHGLTMGLDVCSTFHMGIAPDELHQLTRQLVEQAAPAYLMAVAGNADPMLGYLTTSFRQHPQLRRQAGRRISSAMERRLGELGISNPNAPSATRAKVAALYAQYQKAGGDTRGAAVLEDEGDKQLGELAASGFDLGRGHDAEHGAPPNIAARLDRLYGHARRALYATLSDAVIRDACSQPVRVTTRATDREDYIAHPAAGEALREADRATLRGLYPVERPQIQLVISDGLNADAVNENLRAVLPACRQQLLAAGLRVGERDLVVRNGRVRAGYDLAEVIGPDVLIHFVGERPGTGLDMLSAYLTYGRDLGGQLRWRSELPHSVTTAICGIHRQGKAPAAAVDEIVQNVKRMVERRRSGVELGSSRGTGRFRAG